MEAELANVESWEGEKAENVQSRRSARSRAAQSLKFPPTIAVTPEEPQATLPTGYAVDLRIPQSEGAEGIATADLRDAVIKMPAGVVLSPSAATGLESCSEAQVGIGTESPVECPNASKLGEVSLITPALSGELKGFLYLGGPPSGPITKPPFTVYLTLAGHGVLVKIKGTVVTGPGHGPGHDDVRRKPRAAVQRTESAAQRRLPRDGREPQRLRGIPRRKRPHAVDRRRSAKTRNRRASRSRSRAARRRASRRRSRRARLSNQAGGYSPFRVTFSREDADEDLGGLTVTTPPGLSGNLSKVPLCGEPQAAEGTCPEASQIGEVTAGAGPGPEPVFIKGGKVFLTGPYEGAPFGLSVAVSEKAGPLDLGTGPCDCEVVRATVNVDPHTAQLTVSNGALPTMKDGIPFQVKSVNVRHQPPRIHVQPDELQPDERQRDAVEHPGHDLAQVSSHFQVTNCAALAFNPAFKVSTSGKDQPRERREPRREVELPDARRRARGEHRAGQSRTPQAAAVAADDAAEGLYGRGLRSEPRGLPRGLDGRHREGGHADPPGPADGPRDLRLARRGSVPEPDRRAAGLRRHGRPRRRDVHLQGGDHELDVQDGARRAGRHLRAVPPRGPALRAGRARRTSARASSS